VHKKEASLGITGFHVSKATQYPSKLPLEILMFC